MLTISVIYGNTITYALLAASHIKFPFFRKFLVYTVPADGYCLL